MPTLPTISADEYNRRRSLYADTLRWTPFVEQVAGVSWPSLTEQIKQESKVRPTPGPSLSLIDLLLGQIHTESAGQQFARGKAGELGLLQLMPGTARDMSLDVQPNGYTQAEVDLIRTKCMNDPAKCPPPLVFDPLENIKASVRYTHRIFLMLRQRGWSGTALSTYMLALAGYNGGPGFVLAAIRDKTGEQLIDAEPILQAIKESRVVMHTTRRVGDKVMPTAVIAPPAMARYPETVIGHATMIQSVRMRTEPGPASTSEAE